MVLVAFCPLFVHTKSGRRASGAAQAPGYQGEPPRLAPAGREKPYSPASASFAACSAVVSASTMGSNPPLITESMAKFLLSPVSR